MNTATRYFRSACVRTSASTSIRGFSCRVKGDLYMDKALEIENVTIRYGKVTAVENLSLAVNAGETFGLIGLNGAGKTSLIKTVLGLREAKSGAIKIFGLSPSAKNVRSNLAYLPERFDPPWFLSGMEFIKFSLNLYRRAFEEKEIIRMAERLALDPSVLGRRVQTYSKGMRQKLGIIATISTGCRLLILDEPMSGLDPMARALVKDVLIECGGEGRTIFLTSHILVDMDEICSRVSVLDGGRITFTGSPPELKKITGMESLERAFLHSIAKKDAA